MLSRLVVTVLMCLVLHLGPAMVHSFGDIPCTRFSRLGVAIQMQSFTLQDYIETNLLGSKRTIEVDQFDGPVGFDPTRCYLLLFDYNVRHVDDIDQPETLATFGFLDRLLAKIKSSKQVSCITRRTQTFHRESLFLLSPPLFFLSWRPLRTISSYMFTISDIRRSAMPRELAYHCPCTKSLI